MGRQDPSQGSPGGSGPDYPGDSGSGSGSGSGSDSEPEGGDALTEELEEFYGTQVRTDVRDVTLKLHRATLNHYFKSILAGGGMRYEGREELDAKYYLGLWPRSVCRPPCVARWLARFPRLLVP